MKIVNSILRAIVERVTQIEWNDHRLYVFEHLNEKGVAAERWIQNWECDDVTLNFDCKERMEIYQAVEEYHKSKANSFQ